MAVKKKPTSKKKPTPKKNTRPVASKKPVAKKAPSKAAKPAAKKSAPKKNTKPAASKKPVAKKAAAKKASSAKPVAKKSPPQKAAPLKSAPVAVKKSVSAKSTTGKPAVVTKVPVKPSPAPAAKPAPAPPPPPMPKKGDPEKNMENSDLTGAQIVELYFSGMGGEFQFHRLNREELEELKANYKDAPDEFPWSVLDGAQDFTERVYPGCYGIYIDDMELQDNDTHENVEIDMDKQSIQDAYFDDEVCHPGKADYIYLQKGKVFGTIKVPLMQGEDFVPSKLEFHYVEYCLDGYAEEYGKILVEVLYDGRDCEIETEDNGTDIRRVITFPIFNDDNEYEDYKVVLDQNDDELIIDFNNIP